MVPVASAKTEEIMLTGYTAESRWPDLFREMRRAQDEISRRFGGFGGPRLALRTEFPPVNVWAGADGAVVKAEIAGVSPDQIDITVHQDTVVLRGKRDPEVVDKEAIVHRRERTHGAFSRTVVLPFRVDADKVAARFDRGVLTLELPRPAADKPRHVKVAHA
jgi:HSP20 family protein